MRSALAMARFLDPLGNAPVQSTDYISAVLQQDPTAWGMMLNDTLGDCVCADTAHALMLRTANTGTIVVPTDADVEQLYMNACGYNPSDPSTDQGCVESDVCWYLHTTGWLGHKNVGTGVIDPANLEHIKWCTELFGTCRLGLNLPDFAETQFDNNQPWDVEGDPKNANIIGGHDVPIIKYDQEYFYVVTWGKVQPMTSAFFLAFCEEAHVELYHDWINSTTGSSPGGVKFDKLVRDMAAVEASS